MGTATETRRRGALGYTLVEMVSVIAILSIVALVSSGVLVQGMSTYARTVPAMDASYQLDHAQNVLRRELRDLAGTDTITTMGATSLSFDTKDGTTVTYSLSGTDLLRNGDLLAQGVTALAFRYWAADGTAATAAADVHFLETDLTVTVGSQSQRSQWAAFPRSLSSVLGSSGGGGSGSSTTIPVALWRFDETSGTIAYDSIGANHGTYGSQMNYGLAGTDGTAAEWDTDSDVSDMVVEIPHSSDFLINDGTIQFWFYAYGLSSYHNLLSKDSSGYDDGGHISIFLYYDEVGLRIQSTSSSTYLYTNSVASVNTWHHVAVTFGSGGLRIYVDGTLQAVSSYTGGLGTNAGGTGNTEPFAVGASTQSSGNGTISPYSTQNYGRMDSLAIYDVALTAAEVSALHAGGGNFP